ncbi:acyltransferase family protein [Paenibacillus sp. y28]|uniref:acyltransferase family protein n=1 Tax=Paenibacillus sp. y28 TaxID=3129110 RepID=UPI003017AC50
MVKQLFVMRAFACLCIAMYYAIGTASSSYPLSIHSTEQRIWFYLFPLLLCAAPMFIFISEFLVARAYPDQPKKGFLVNRLRYMMIPYVSMGIFYAAFEAGISRSLDIFTSKLWSNMMLGGFHGYFVLIIFQFYLLHLFFHKIADACKPVIVLAGAFLIQAAYLWLAAEFWYEPGQRFSFWWYPFTGWLFYFTAAYYAGRYDLQFEQLLSRHWKWIAVLLPIAGAMFVWLYPMNLFPLGSKRPDIIIYAIAAICALFLVATKIKRPPKLIVWISQLSFGIYLLNPFFYRCFEKVLSGLLVPHLSFSLYTFVLFGASTSASMLAVWLLQRLPLGSYLVGKIGKGFHEEREAELRSPKEGAPLTPRV